MKNESVLKRLEKYMGGRRALLPLSLVTSALSAAAGMMPYIFIWLIVRSLLMNSGRIAGTSAIGYAWWAAGTAVLSVVLYFIALMSSHLAAFRVEGNIRREAMKKIVNMPLGFFDNNTSGRIRKIIDDDSSTTHTFLAHQLPDFAGTIVMPLATVAMIFIFDWRLGLACMIPLVLAFGTMGIMMTTSSMKFQKLYMDALEDMSTEAVEYVRGIPVVKVFQQTIFSFKRFHDSILKYNDLVKKYTDSWEKPYSFYGVIVHCFAFFLVPMAILLIGRSGNSSQVIVDMFLYVLLTPMLSVNISKSMHISQHLFLAGEAITRIESLTDVAPYSYSENPVEMRGFDVSFNDVFFKYPGAEQNAVDGVSFAVPQGKTYALVGASGGGKTTIARLIPRFWDVQEGSVSIGGADVRNISKGDLMNNISFVFQNTRLFKTSLLENIRYGNADASMEEVERALELAQCREIIDRLPDGLDTRIGVDGTYLSGGEQQRIALARAFLKDAPIVVLDEATAFADPENEHLIQSALRELTKGKTVLMIVHRLTTGEDVDKILVINGGKIAESGSHGELMARNGIYTGMWNEYQQAVEWTIESEVSYA
jgi:ATP-binding cassette subfamily B protein